MTDNQRILVTGGAGYVGSHTVVCLLEAGYRVVVVDDLKNAYGGVAERIRGLCPGGNVSFLQGDLRDRKALTSLMASQHFSAVMHFAASKSVPESLGDPLAYYDNNVAGTLSLLGAMTEAGVMCMIFSSSAAVYGPTTPSPVSEAAPSASENPYGRSKSMMETAIADVLADGSHLSLRYFNPVGAHPSALIGECPRRSGGNLMPQLCAAAAGGPPLTVFGTDYPTPDGSCIRDFVHVMDVAEAHLAALERVLAGTGGDSVNIGTGSGCSVLELIRTFEDVNDCSVPRFVAGRRPGDVACLYADVDRSGVILRWRARRDLSSMCRDAWRWYQAADRTMSDLFWPKLDPDSAR
jgi:UDP-glucose 4-epimerase